MDIEFVIEKQQFALALLHNPHDARRVAYELFGDKLHIASKAANNWCDDPYVIFVQQKAIKKFGHAHFLPTKAKYAYQIQEKAARANDPRMEIYYMKMLGEVLGYNVNERAMKDEQVNPIVIIPDHGEDDEWERRLEEQQHRLTNE